MRNLWEPPPPVLKLLEQIKVVSRLLSLTLCQAQQQICNTVSQSMRHKRRWRSITNMKKLIFILAFLLALPLRAATPITCTALAGLGYNFIYFGFTGTSTDLFTIAGSHDGSKWTNIGGSWPTCGNGTPCLVNAPSAVCYGNNLYLLMAEASDSNYYSTYQDIGVLNTDYSVTTLLRFDWSSLGSVSTIFAGNWKKVPGYTNCFDTPVSFTPGYYTFSTYTACASLTPTGVSITSGPTLLTTTGSTGYDPQVIQQGSTCNLIQTATVSGYVYRVPSISTGSCPNGPFTFQTQANMPGSVLAGATLNSTNEGPNYVQANVPGGWYFFNENLTGRQMVSANCTPIVITSCLMPTPAPWNEDYQYRHGDVLYFGTAPSTGVQMQGSGLKLTNATVQ